MAPSDNNENIEIGRQSIKLNKMYTKNALKYCYLDYPLLGCIYKQ